MIREGVESHVERGIEIKMTYEITVDPLFRPVSKNNPCAQSHSSTSPKNF